MPIVKIVFKGNLYFNSEAFDCVLDAINWNGLQKYGP